MDNHPGEPGMGTVEAGPTATTTRGRFDTGGMTSFVAG